MASAGREPRASRQLNNSSGRVHWNCTGIAAFFSTGGRIRLVNATVTDSMSVVNINTNLWSICHNFSSCCVDLFPPHISHPSSISTLLQFSALLHTIYAMFLSPPWPLAVKPSVLQLQQFGIPSHSVSGNHHNSFIYPPRLVHFPTQRHQHLRLEHA